MQADHKRGNTAVGSSYPAYSVGAMCEGQKWDDAHAVRTHQPVLGLHQHGN